MCGTHHVTQFHHRTLQRLSTPILSIVSDEWNLVWNPVAMAPQAIQLESCLCSTPSPFLADSFHMLNESFDQQSLGHEVSRILLSLDLFILQLSIVLLFLNPHHAYLHMPQLSIALSSYHS